MIYIILSTLLAGLIFSCSLCGEKGNINLQKKSTAEKSKNIESNPTSATSFQASLTLPLARVFYSFCGVSMINQM